VYKKALSLLIAFLIVLSTVAFNANSSRSAVLPLIPGLTLATPSEQQGAQQIVIKLVIGSTTLTVNGQSQVMDTVPIISGARTLLPIRYVAAPLGANVDWSQAEQKATVSLAGKTITLWIGQSDAQINGTTTPIDSSNPAVTPEIVPPGRTMLPLRFITENLGCQVAWDQVSQTVTITYGGGGTTGNTIPIIKLTGTGSGRGMVQAAPDPSSQSEKDKMAKMDLQHRLARPVYDTRLALFVATQPGKPAALTASLTPTVKLPLTLHSNALLLPSLQGSSNLSAVNPNLLKAPSAAPNGYSASPYACFIDKSGDQTRWFAYNLNNAPGAANVVWQVSRSPLAGFKTDWQHPAGLVASGQVAASAGAFSINFSTFAANQSFTRIPAAQRTYYVRAVPVDAGGACIGDPGAGLAVSYGKILTAQPLSNVPLAPSFELWSFTGQGNYFLAQTDPPPQKGGPTEFPNEFAHLTQGGFGDNQTAPLWFQFHGFDQAADKIVLQVSMQNFDNLAGDWESPAHLVYSQTYTLPIATAQYQAPDSVPLNLQGFGPSVSEINAAGGINYYVRAVALKPTSMPGTETVLFSDTVAIAYGPPATVQIIAPPQPATVPSYTPNVQLVGYTPVRFEWCNWYDYYCFTRTPQPQEVNFTFKAADGTVIPPYPPSLVPGEAQQLWISQYGQLLPKYMHSGDPNVPGSDVVVTITQQDDSSWWGDLWKAICDFFSDLVDLVAKVVNWVSAAYNGLKEGLINFVADDIPGLKDVIEAAVDIGLGAMGIPPTLPNFDELAHGGLDYLAATALDEAGVPDNQYTEQMLEQVAGGIGQQISQAANSDGAPNPINAAFLKNAPEYQYRPAYIDLQVTNPYQDRPTPSGTINVSVTESIDKMNYENQCNSGKGDDFQLENYSLDANNNPNDWDFPVFFPVHQPLPSLPPGAKTTVRIYLQEWYGQPYPWSPPSVGAPGFDTFQWLYSGAFGPSQFNVSVDFNLPDINQAAQAAGVSDQGGGLKWDSSGYGASFSDQPAIAYTP
jgi:hypothetical protein